MAHRLERNAQPAATAGCALAIGIVLLAIGALPVYMTITHDEPGSRTFYYIVGGGFGLVGLLLVYSGEERWATYVSTSKGRRTNWQTKHLGTFNFLDHGVAEINHVPLDVLAPLEVPREIAATREEHGDDRRSISWKVEVWGNVRARADFMHAFPVTVE